MSTNAEAYYNAEAYEYSQSNPTAGHLQTASATTNIHAPPRETINKTASAIKPVPPPKLSKSKKITDSGYQPKTIPKNMSGSCCQNNDMNQNVPIPGQSNNKTSAVIFNDETTSALKGFNHLSQLKGERVGSPVGLPSLQAILVMRAQRSFNNKKTNPDDSPETVASYSYLQNLRIGSSSSWNMKFPFDGNIVLKDWR